MLNISVTICDIRYLSWLIPMLAWWFPFRENESFLSYLLIKTLGWLPPWSCYKAYHPIHLLKKKIEWVLYGLAGSELEIHYCCHWEARLCFRFMARSYYLTSRRHLILIDGMTTTVAMKPIWITRLWEGGYPNCFTCLIQFLELSYTVQALIDVEAWNWKDKKFVKNFC